ncbi:MAG: NGG1p interacting factor NIF3 [bacterium]|nr:NGG1p interacting factor NIF3 [bacterium]
MDFSQVYIVTFITRPHIESLLNAIADAGGGVIGQYTHCAFTTIGTGHFKPLEGANPRFGDKLQVNQADEWRVETFCERSVAKEVIEAIKAVHPYDQPVIYMMPLIDENQL